jgi:hypothetical protein
MAARRLVPKGHYPGSAPVWCSMPPDYPTEQTERVYRYLLEEMRPGSQTSALMTEGFRAVAYRFRAASEYQSGLESSFQAPGGRAPPGDGQYLQERAIFGFFMSGQAALESFAFAVHAIGAHYRPSPLFGLSVTQLENVHPKSVTTALAKFWPNGLLTNVMQKLLQDQTFKTWATIRNVLGHRAVPTRSIQITPGREIRVTWLFSMGGHRVGDESLESAMKLRRPWLAATLRELWDGLEQSFPPP